MMKPELDPVKKPENEADREVLTKLLIALAAGAGERRSGSPGGPR